MQTGDEREQDEQVFANTCDDASSFDRGRRIYRIGDRAIADFVVRWYSQPNIHSRPNLAPTVVRRIHLCNYEREFQESCGYRFRYSLVFAELFVSFAEIEVP